MIETFKILSGIYDTRVTNSILQLNESHITRGHTMKLCKHRSKKGIRKYSFAQRVTDIWNGLPDYIVISKSVHQFENRLDRYWEKHPMKYDYTEDYKPYAGNKPVKGLFHDEELPIEDREVLRAETT